MTAAIPSDLDLANTIRPGLDILANEIVIALKKRTRFVCNDAIYRPGLVRGEAERTLLDHSLAGIERLHGELGRYTYATQDAFSDVAGIAPVIERAMPVSPVHPMPSRVGPCVLAFYLDWLQHACALGDDPSTYGETVTADVSALLAIMERVNLGKPVAEAKFRELECAMRATGGERAALRSLIVHPEREANVLELAGRLAERYDLPPEQARSVFEFMIRTTIDIEIDYLAQRIARHDPAQPVP